MAAWRQHKATHCMHHVQGMACHPEAASLRQGAFPCAARGMHRHDRVMHVSWQQAACAGHATATCPWHGMHGVQVMAAWCVYQASKRHDAMNAGHAIAACHGRVEHTWVVGHGDLIEGTVACTGTWRAHAVQGMAATARLMRRTCHGGMASRHGGTLHGSFAGFGGMQGSMVHALGSCKAACTRAMCRAWRHG